MKPTLKTFVILALALTGIASLATTQASKGQANTGQATAGTVHTTSRSAPPPILRSLASELSEEELETSFQALLNDAKPGERARAHLERVIRIYFRAQSYLNDFDKNLDEAHARNESLDLHADETYLRLQSARILSERERDRIVYMYRRIHEIQRGNEATARQRNAALEINREIKILLNSARGDSRRVALMDLVEELKPLLKDALVSRAKQQPATLSFKDAMEAGQFFGGSVALELNQKATETAGDHELNQEIEMVTEEIKASTLNSENREPQGATIAAAAGSSGNVSGAGFAGWALTYDDGPHAKHTLAILKNLQTYGHKATFFWLAKLAPSMPAIVGKVKAAGMDLANHSYSHAQLTKSSTNRELEIVTSTRKLEAVYGQPVKLFRCPYGACGPNGGSIRAAIASRGMIHVGWNVDSLDWQDKNPASVYNRVKKQMATKSGGIILFHDIQPQTVEASRRLMADFTSAGKKLHSAQDLIDQVNGR